MNLPSALGIADTDSFAWQVFHKRHPKLIERLFEAHPYGSQQRAALAALLEESIDGVIAELPDDALWQDWSRGITGAPWSQATFLWAESYFYRRILEAVGYFTPGAWIGVDPFGPFKATELSDPVLNDEYSWVRPPARTRQGFEAVVLSSLYGNQADLSFLMQVAGGTHDDRLVADDTNVLWEFLVGQRPERVNLVLDNAGRELLSDLIFADFLLTSQLVDEMVLHAKPHPYYVSDATTTDVGNCIRRLSAMPGEAGAAGERIMQAAAADQLRIRTNPFWCAPLSFHEMPAELVDELQGGLGIFKGDLNYRRVVGDCAWDPVTPLHEAVSYLPYPAALLRTLKSEGIVGLDASRVRELNIQDPGWRTNGTQALVQAVGLA